MKKRILDSVFSLVISGIQACATVFIIELIYRGSWSDTIVWAREYTRPFAYNWLLLFLLIAGFHMFKRKLYILFSSLLTIPLLVLALASYIKQSIRAMPVVPSDLALTSEAENMSQLFSQNLLIWAITGFIILCAIIGFLVYKVPNQKNRNWFRISVSFILMFLFALTFSTESKASATYLQSSMHIVDNAWDQKSTYLQDGVLAGFTVNMKWLSQEKPKNYSQATINKLIKATPKPKYSNSDKPNIVMIMNEAFWDPTRMENVQLNKDPLPYFHQLQQQQTSGWLNVSVYGGGTANTEFEALTGLSTQLLPTGSIAYLNYVNKPLPSLANILREQGYDTTAIHTWHNWFYDRSDVYKELGFNRFIPFEFMANPVPHGQFVDDSTMTNQILEKLNSNNNGKPNFIFGVTTQNHGPYDPNYKYSYASMTANLKNGKTLSHDAKGVLEVYSDNLTQIDNDIHKLIDGINKTHKKTILIFFGDHLPLLGNDYDLYRQANYYSDSNKSYDQYLKMYSTPLLIWDNFSEKKENLNTVGSSMLSPIILDRAGLTGDNLTNFLLSNYKNGEFTSIPRQDYWNKVNQTALNNYKLLQYDTLFGKMYSAGNDKPQPSKDYRLGYHNPIISSIKIGNEQGKKVWIVKGSNLTNQSYVYVNNKKANRISNTSTKLIIPYSNIAKGTKITVKVIDSNEKVLSSSNVLTY